MPRERRYEAKEIVLGLGVFGVPRVGTDGIGTIYLRYKDHKYSEFLCTPEGPWMYYDPDSGFCLDEPVADAAWKIFDSLHSKSSSIRQ